MAHWGVVVKHIHSDRGSEYFSQEGELIASRDRTISEFDYFCFTQNIRHTVTPIGLKEKIAETWFRDTFLAVDALLWDARLSPAFWCDACAYVSYVTNRTPSSKTGPSTPWTMLTGERTRWDKLRVFGADAYLHRPNNVLAKIPGLVRGQKLIFVGFSDGMNGYRLFDPENRRYHTHSDVVFYESFNHRIDALRHHDKRRDMIKKGIEQPVLLDDFQDENADGVRNLFLHPDAAKPASTPLTTGSPSLVDIPVPPVPPAASRVSHAPATHDSARAQEALRSAVKLRPLRILPVGRVVKATVEDMEFLRHIQKIHAPIAFVLNPKRKGTLSHRRYQRYMHATTVQEAFQLGATKDDIIWDYERAFIKFPKHESDLPGHIFNCLEVSELYGHSHALEDVSDLVSPTDHADFMLQRAFASQALERARYIFNDAIATAYEPELLPSVLRNNQAAARFAEHSFHKVLKSTSVNIDFSLSPEPLKYEEAIDSGECDDWKKAMDDEMKSMHLFGVFRKVPKSAARGRQILGCKWVYKRKVNKFGEVNRHKARLVAQGFAQREYDSFNPDEITSPVAHKTSLRLFLSVCAAENLKIFQADVKNAFLQAPLSERIYMRAPPGYSSQTEAGEDEIIELRKAVYGLKQSSACFWTAMNDHLKQQGFTSLLGDPCVFRKVLPSGKVILACTYVDDVTLAVPDLETRDYFMELLRQRFVIDEGEGEPIEWLLGMAIHQDLEAGTVRIDMETAITKLAHGVLTEEELVKASSVDYPMLVTPLLKLKERTVPKSVFDYLSVVGSLMHFANCVRLDIALAVGVLARHAMAPGPAHVKAVKRVVQYLFATRSLGITYTRPQARGAANVPIMYEGAQHPLDNGANLLQTFADSDYAADITRRSTMGSVVMLNGGPISWSSVLGKTVATSTCEAEINAAVAAAKDALHLSNMLQGLKIARTVEPLQIAEDNAACIAQANAGIKHVRNAKHYEVKLRFLQQLVVEKKIKFQYCPTDHQLADLFTKPLDKIKFTYLRKQMMD